MNVRRSIVLAGLGLFAAAQPAIAQNIPPAKPQPAGANPAPAVSQPAQAAPGPYRVVKTFPVGGEGGWDFLCVDPETDRLYVPRATRVMVLDAQTGASVGEIAGTDGVHGVALGLGKGFTSNGKSDSVTVFDLKTLAILGTVKVGQRPDAILYEPTTRRVFTFNGQSHDATAVNAEDLSVAGTVALGGKPEVAVADGQGNIFVNLEDTSEVVRFDASGLTVKARFPLAPGEGPSGLAIDPARHRLFAVCGNKQMVVLDSESGKVLAMPGIGDRVDGAAFDAANGYALSANGEGTLTVVSEAGDKPFAVVQTLQTAPGARTIALNPKTGLIYLPTAEFEPLADKDKAAGKTRPTMKPGTFRIVVVGR